MAARVLWEHVVWVQIPTPRRMRKEKFEPGWFSERVKKEIKEQAFKEIEEAVKGKDLDKTSLESLIHKIVEKLVKDYVNKIHSEYLSSHPLSDEEEIAISDAFKGDTRLVEKDPNLSKYSSSFRVEKIIKEVSLEISNEIIKDLKKYS